MVKNIFLLQKSFGETHETLKARSLYLEQQLARFTFGMACGVCEWIVKNVQGWPSPADINNAEKAIGDQHYSERLSAIKNYIKYEIPNQEKAISMALQCGFECDVQIEIGVDPLLLAQNRALADKKHLETLRYLAENEEIKGNAPIKDKTKTFMPSLEEMKADFKKLLEERRV